MPFRESVKFFDLCNNAVYEAARLPARTDDHNQEKSVRHCGETLEEKKAALEKAYEKLYDLTQERDEVLKHRIAKLEQLRQELDMGTTTDVIQRAKVYLKIVDEKLSEKEKKVVEQQKVVDAAQKQVDIATDDLFQKKKDLEKLELHKKEWEKEMGYWVQQKEGVEQDEQGSSTHFLHKKEGETRKKHREKKENEPS